MYWYSRGQAVDARRWLELAIGLGSELPPGDLAAVHAGLAYILTFQGRADLARSHSDAAASLLPRIAPTDLAFVGDLLAITAAAAMTTEEPDHMTTVFTVAKKIAAEVADPDLSVLCDAVQGLVDVSSGGDPQLALEAAESVSSTSLGRPSSLRGLSRGIIGRLRRVGPRSARGRIAVVRPGDQPQPHLWQHPRRFSDRDSGKSAGPG